MINDMSDKPHVRTENLDDDSSEKKQSAPAEAKKVLDETAVSKDNQKPKRGLKIGALNLATEGKDMTKTQKKRVMILGAVAIIAGIGTGYGAFRLRAKSSGESSPATTQQVAGDNVQAGDVFGIKDDQTFKDSAEGYLEAGGINGEGSHSLLREGGASQTVYLTSSITDLDKLVGMKVKVWGETFKGQKAGWLMDVGRVQVIEVDAKAPVTE
jgi:hypothetical protein